MKRFVSLLCCLVLTGAALLSWAAEPTARTAPAPASAPTPHAGQGHVEFPPEFHPWDAPALAAFEARLAAFEREQGTRILVRFHAKSPTEEEDKVPGAYMRGLSTKLGTIERGVLIVYFLDEPDWRMWLGDSLTPKFTGKSGTAQELTASGAIHDTKEAFFTEVTAKADAAFLAAMKASDIKEFPAAHPKRIALHAETMVDGLVTRLGAK